MAEEKKECPWCGRKDGCDCKERMECPKAGQVGHQYCGTHPCGCPKFLLHDCPKKEKK